LGLEIAAQEAVEELSSKVCRQMRRNKRETTRNNEK
jgi:hypothetical protein